MRIVPAVSMIVGSLAALLSAPLVTAVEPFSLVTDPRGDAGPSGFSAPAGADAWDLVDVSVTEQDEEALVFTFSMAGPVADGVPGERALLVRVGVDHWLLGWTTIVFPAVPPMYQGGFYCPSDADGTTDPATCDAFPAAASTNGFVVTAPRATLGALDAGVEVQAVRAYADAYNYDGSIGRLDAATGEALFVTAQGTGAGGAAPAAPATDAEVANVTPAAEADMPVGRVAPQADAPGASILLLGAAFAVAGLVRRQASR